MPLSWPVVAAVPCGAALHAGWNVLVKSAADKPVDTALVHFLGAVVALPLLLWVGQPAAGSAPFIAASLVIRVGYCAALAGACRHVLLLFALDGLPYPLLVWAQRGPAGRRAIVACARRRRPLATGHAGAAWPLSAPAPRRCGP